MENSNNKDTKMRNSEAFPGAIVSNKNMKRTKWWNTKINQGKKKKNVFE